ncbi:hypothetical protein ACFOEE_18825 [Pseudoalteromonas fenneropenaei]|uniref:DUF3375 domain-containing protein n=1 Tax=Pseudoalteromonas fenneropenaei TaxID=1737459 RepID=A0ABV7CPE0_9GAMM
MIPAKKILNTINEHWSMLELLFKRFKHSDFSLKDVQNLLKYKNPNWTSERLFKEANKLLTLEIIIPLAKSSQLELNRAIADFMSYLLQEEDLGLAQEITVLVQDLERLGNRLAEAGQVADHGELRRFSRIMDERVRKIVKLYQHNEGAIFNIVEQAKADHSNLSLQKRYQAVLEAFDEYIEPMLNMVDIHGPFHACFSTIETQISDQIALLSTLGRGIEDKRMLEQLRTRILDMHLVGRESLRRSADMLLPLREELRRNTLITRQAAKVLQLIRKNGVDNVLNSTQPHFVSDVQRFSLGQQRHMVAYMASLCEFEDETYQLPDERDVPSYQSPFIPDYQDVTTKLKHFSGKKTQLIGFLTDAYPALEADELLFLYQKLISDDAFNLTQDEQKTRLVIGEQTFALYPFNAANKAD